MIGGTQCGATIPNDPGEFLIFTKDADQTMMRENALPGILRTELLVGRQTGSGGG